VTLGGVAFDRHHSVDTEGVMPKASSVAVENLVERDEIL
jgi:hypothetical protein